MDVDYKNDDGGKCSSKRKLTTKNVKSENDKKCAKVKNKETGEVKSKQKTPKERGWKKTERETIMHEYTLDESFNEENFGSCKTATDYFLRMVGNKTIDDIIYQSNLLGTQRNKILNLKRNEFLAFIGINFFMGYHALPSYKNYWSTAEDLGVPLIRKTMTRDRFHRIFM